MKKNNFLLIIFILVVVFWTGGCDDIFEKDISNYSVELYSPVEELETTDTNVKFWWSTIEGAASYNLQIVTPSFSQTDRLVLDTIVSGNSYLAELNVGEYQWQVKALNSVSQTGYSVNSLSIKPKFNIGKEKVILVSPEDGYVATENSIYFEWNDVLNANTYTVIIKKDSWDSNSEVFNSALNTASLNFPLPDGAYVWGVSANDSLNNKSTDFTIHKLTVDSSSPESPVLFHPTGGTVLVNTQIRFSWEGVEENASYELLVFNAKENTQPILEKIVADTVYTAELPGDGQYLWKVRTFDKAQNESGFSELASFALQQLPSLEEQQVEIIVPSDGSVIKENQLTIWWDQIEGANEYHVLVVAMGFENPEKLVYDEWGKENKVSLELEVGQYEVRVLASNEISRSPYTTSAFEIYIQDLSGQSIHLKSPSDNLYSSERIQHFSWNGMSGDVTYWFLLKEGDWESGTVIMENAVERTEYQYELNEGYYSWGVKAVDTQNGSETDYASRTLTIDNTVPSIPVLKSPLSQADVSDYNVTFSWEDPDNDEGTTQKYLWEVYRVANGTETLAASINTSVNTLSYSFDAGGSYRWQVRTIDLAGNVGPFSSKWEFFINGLVDISNTSVSIIAPEADLETSNNTVTFWWEEVSGAEKYIFQLVSPDFGHVETIIEDTELTGNQKSATLSPGNYQWRIKAVNSKYETSYSTRSLVILP